MTLQKILMGLTVVALAAAVTPAMADNGKSNGKGAAHSSAAKTNGNGKSASQGDDTAEEAPGKGGLASELKGLNAVKANPNALEHASPNSQVGRIAAYQDAALATLAVQSNLDAANTTLAGLAVPSRDVASIDADIAALDPAAVDYAEALAALEAERETAAAYEDAVAAVDAATLQLETAAIAEDAALLIASDGRILSDEAVAYIRDVLNL